MRTARLLQALAVTALLAAACGSANTPATGNATPAFTTNPTPTVTAIAPQPGLCQAPSNRCLVLVTLRGSSAYVVRDITDIGHATTVSTVRSIGPPQFVSATDLSYVDGDALVRVPLAGSPTTAVTTSRPGFRDFVWSPDGKNVVYVIPSNSSLVVHQLSAGVDRVIGTMPAGGPVGCETVANCPGADAWEFLVSYSPDGTLISLVNSIANISVFRLWTSDGKVLKTSDSQSPFMSAWSGRSLYFRDAKGVEVWRDGTVSSFLPGVAWIRPKASPGGGQIVYETRDAQRWAHTYVVDTTSGKVRDLGKAHAEPVFLTTRYIWYQGERACVAADQCGTRVAGVPSGKAYIYDLQDGTETESLITSVYDVWPHAA